MDKFDWEVENEKRKMKQDILVTEHKKNKFIGEIKNGLGDRIVKEPNKEQKKPSFLQKIKTLLFS
jgi:hypothetical protein